MTDTRPTTAADVLAMDAAHTQPSLMCKECDRLVRKYEAQGMTHGDATGVAQADHLKATGRLM